VAHHDNIIHGGVEGKVVHNTSPTLTGFGFFFFFFACKAGEFIEIEKYEVGEFIEKCKAVKWSP
jgi:hypothetical protein